MTNGDEHSLRLLTLARKSAIPAENTAIIDSSVLFPIDSGARYPL